MERLSVLTGVRTILVHLASGIGNIVLATPLLALLSRHGFTVDVLVDGDYSDTSELLCGWGAIRSVFNKKLGDSPSSRYDLYLPAIPPFYWQRYAATYRGMQIARPPDALFYRNERDYYLAFARELGCDMTIAPDYFVPVASSDGPMNDVVLAPGCKTGEMAAKRWPFFPELAERFENVAVVGTPDDLTTYDGTTMRFSSHVRSFVGKLSLRETATILASARAVVANDSGLGHLAGACGVPTLLLFGPTPDLTLGRFPPNVTVVRAGLHCEPCWFTSRFARCGGRIDCLKHISVQRVFQMVRDAVERLE